MLVYVTPMPGLKTKFTEGGFKAVVLGAAAILVTGAAEAYRAGDIESAILLGAIGSVAFLIHEAISQYRFAWSDEFHALVAANLEGLEPPDDGDGDECGE